jgi:hypothetical protein
MVLSRPNPAALFDLVVILVDEFLDLIVGQLLPLALNDQV